MGFSFEILARDAGVGGGGAARVGRVYTAHGSFETPAFMAVGTRGSIKGVTPEQARAEGCEVVLGNTYHLLLRPGAEVVAALGGLQRFSGWKGPMLTDSGGYQVFSLAELREFEDGKGEVGSRKLEEGTKGVEQVGENPRPSRGLTGGNSGSGQEPKVTGDGVVFRSHIDGAVIRLTPEESMRVQHLLGADIIMAFDDCPPADCPPLRLRQSMERTHRWAEICKREHERLVREGVGPHFAREAGGTPAPQAEKQKMGGMPVLQNEIKDTGGTPVLRGWSGPALFGIVQGGTDLAARAESARFLTGLDLPGYAIGGLAVGEGHERMVEVIGHTAPLLPEDKPRYLMGVGYAADILEAVRRGVDMFDCVLPTRNGRNGLAFTFAGTRRLRNAKYAMDKGPLEEGCDCYCCRNFSRGYLRHLFNVEEMLGPTLVSIHNLRFFQRWMGMIRAAIREGRLAGLHAPSEELCE